MVWQSFYRPMLTLALVLSFGAVPTLSYAQSIDVPEDEELLDEPTPIEEFAPTEEGEVIPGTEPLYDKGITVTQIEIYGNQLVPAKTILEAMTTHPGSLYSKRRLQSDLRKVYDLGYFTEHLRVIPIATKDGVHLKVEVEENPIVEKFVFENESELKEEELQKLFSPQVGMPQNVNAINKGIQDIENLYKDKGFVLARVDSIDEPERGTVKLVINEGKINKITYSGNTKTKNTVLRRAMAQKEGQIYNEKVVSDDMKRLFSMQTFSDVRRVVKASPEAPGQYDLAIEVDEKKTGTISLGGGIDTAYGLFGSVGYSDPNFRGYGQNFSTVFSLGTGALGTNNVILQRTIAQFQTSWYNPSIAETTNSLGINLSARQLGSFNVPLAIESRMGTSATWSRPLESLPNTSVSTGLGFERVHLREGVFFSTARDRVKQLSGRNLTVAERDEQLDDGSFVFLDPAIAYDTRDNRFNPSSGWLNSLTGRAAAGIGADSYGTLTANLRRYLKVTDNVTFAVNAQGGGTALGDIPTFNMFNMGGAYSVRGFQQAGVGVGKHYVLGSAEIRAKLPILKRFKKLPFYDMVQVALFADAGKLFDEADTNEMFDRPGSAISFGAGARVNMPSLGPIRIDWAVPLGDVGSQRRSFNFGVGQKF